MNKKGQITLIIAITFFIIIIAALIFYVVNYYKKNQIDPLIFERASIENYINNCVKKTAEEGLKLLGKQGSIVLDDSIKTPNADVAYYFNNANKVPSIEKIQNDLSLHMNKNLNVCLKDFEDFKKQGWDVEKVEVNAKTQINQEDVLFEINLPLKVSDKVNTINFEKSVARLDVRLKYIYDLINKIVDFNTKYKRQIDMTTLNDYDVDVTVIDYEGSLVYNIKDPKSLIRNEPYVFRFAVK